MKKIGLFLLSFLIVTTTSFLAFSQSSETEEEKKKKKGLKNQAQPSADISFDKDLLIRGKYHFSSEAVLTVEEDKVLDSLLEIRKNFRDRLEKSIELY